MKSNSGGPKEGTLQKFKKHINKWTYCVSEQTIFPYSEKFEIWKELRNLLILKFKVIWV